MAVTKITYGAATTVPGLILDSLVAGGNATSSSVANATDLALDTLISVSITTAAGTLATPALVPIYILGSLDNSTFTDVANAPLLGTTLVSTAGTTATLPPSAMAQALGGEMPPYWKLYVVNNTGLALASAGNSATYTEITATTA